MRFVILPRLGLLLVLALVTGEAKADLSAKQAKKLITRMAGVELPSSAVRVKRVTSPNNSTAEGMAEIQAIFRLAPNSGGYWRVVELRVGQLGARVRRSHLLEPALGQLAEPIQVWGIREGHATHSFL